MIRYLDEVAKQLSETKAEKGFSISKLAPNLRIILQTQKSKYEIEYWENNIGLITGGTRSDNTIRFLTPTKIKLLGSSWGGTMLRMDWIGKDMKFEFKDKQTNSHYITSFILGAAIESLDKSYCFILDW